MPKPICQKLSLLHDQVPPMPPAQVRASIEGELGAPLEQVFEWINLEKPLGSASISQVRAADCRPNLLQAAFLVLRTGYAHSSMPARLRLLV